MNDIFPVPHYLSWMLKNVPALRNSFIVGGSVRDWLMGFEPKDFDVEVYGVEYDELVAALEQFGRVDVVGKSFGVVKLTAGGATYDFSLPRLDSKVSVGHRGFEVKMDAGLTPLQAAMRRDFTINGLAYDPREEHLIDPSDNFQFINDLGNKTLRHIGHGFSDDPLRVLRGMQFAGRFDMEVCEATAQLCMKIKHTFNELAVERVWGEWFKWASKSTVPSRGIKFLLNTTWLEHFPEIRNLRNCEQDPEWHPEGDAFVHTLHCCDWLAKSPVWQNKSAEDRATLMLAVLCHDLGKPLCTTTAKRDDGVIRVVSPGHDVAGGTLASWFLNRIGAPEHVKRQVVALVENHMAHLHQPSYRTVRRLALRLAPATIDQLVLVMEADHSGRPPLPPGLHPWAYEIAMLAAELDVQVAPPKPILMGRHLIELGMEPGIEMGVILKKAFEAQMNDEFNSIDGALKWLKGGTNE